ncbi:sulfatase [bacterium]|nr:sulfatase [candidate division CSSED10-310 bacterium]
MTLRCLSLAIYLLAGCEYSGADFTPDRASASNCNVVLITIDCLRADHVGCYGYPRTVTPHLDALARSSHTMVTAYSQAGWTIPSVASILTGLYPSQHLLITPDTRLGDRVQTMAEFLSIHGYATAAVLGHIFFKETYNINQGFRVYDLSTLELGDPHLVRTSPHLTARALTVLGDLPEPFFLWVHYFDPHSEYLPHQKYRFGDQPKDLYDGEIAFTDAAIGGLLAGIQDRGVWDRTIIMVVSDHGEEFREHRGINHETLYEEVVRIPVIIRVPPDHHRLKQPALEPAPMRQVDILPTLAALLDFSDVQVGPGANALAVSFNAGPLYLEREAFWNKIKRRAVMRGSDKLVITFEKNGIRKELFDLQADPAETRNLVLQQPGVVEDLERILATCQVQDPAAAIQRIELEEELAEGLRAMGYLQ